MSESAPDGGAPLQTVQEFSLEEANFSDCDIPDFDLSGVAPVEAAEPKEEDGLRTLAFISDLAKKLDVNETQWHDAEEQSPPTPAPTPSKKQQRISDVSLLSDELLDESAGHDTDDKNDTAELLNDTIERMERLLGMGVDYLDQQDEPQKVHCCIHKF